MTHWKRANSLITVGGADADLALEEIPKVEYSWNELTDKSEEVRNIWVYQTYGIQRHDSRKEQNNVCENATFVLEEEGSSLIQVSTLNVVKYYRGFDYYSTFCSFNEQIYALDRNYGPKIHALSLEQAHGRLISKTEWDTS